MPEKFWSKNLYAFGKSEFSSLIESLIENKKQRLVERLGDFDTLAQSQFCKLNFSETCLRDAYLAIYAWWLTLRLCCYPIAAARKESNA